MRFRFGLALTALLTASLASAQGSPFPALSVDYSADRTIESEAGTFTGKVHVSGQKQRSETNMEGMQSVMIVRGDTKQGFMLMPAQRMAMALAYAQARQQSASGPPDDVSISVVGSEAIEGSETTKYKMLMKDGSAGGFLWITREGIIVKMDMLQKERGKKTRTTVTLRNVKIGPQDAALFEVPADYAQMPAMGGLGMPGMGPRP
jgi:outer membrane lipoprotein-sorting protein